MYLGGLLMDFFEILAKTKNKIRWTCGQRYTYHGEPRGGSGQIRGRIRCGPFKGKVVCQVTAVYLELTGNYIECGQARLATQYLSNNLMYQSGIIGAAD